MSQSAKQGTILLTAAQAWHALSSYVIFVTAARMLGEERFGDFGLVAWTMTTLETLVIAGVPRSVSYYIARTADSAGIIAVRGVNVTPPMAAALPAPLVAAPPRGARWRRGGNRTLGRRVGAGNSAAASDQRLCT